MACGFCGPCKQGEREKCPVTTPPSPTIGDLLRSLGFSVNDDGVRAALTALKNHQSARS